MANVIAKGKYAAKAIEWSQFTPHEKTGNEEIRVLFNIEQEGEFQGRTITWRGYATEATAERTIESLRYMGWQGDDITDVQGLDRNTVQLVVDHEEYNGKTQVKVIWVNRLAGVFVGTPMDASKKQAFAQRMKGLVLATKGTAGATPTRQPAAAGTSLGTPPPGGSMPGGDFPFGHQAPKSSNVKL